ncbi:MAG: S8 family serine peptidase [Lachnospiraceae bacterium]|nr:S8 family serine peptidase [Lachnospiraceae bacterium]
MRTGLKQRLLAVLIAVAMTVSQSGVIYAAESVSGGNTAVSEAAIPSDDAAKTPAVPKDEDTDDQVSENETVSEESVPEGTDETVSDNAAEETAGSDDDEVSEEEPVSENSVSEDTVEADLNGMPEGFALSDEEILGKKRIAEHDVISQLEGLTPGVDYVEDEVIFYCNDPEYAETVAKAYNGTLDSCELGVAVIKLDTDKVSVKQAVAAGCDDKTLLPPVDANYKVYLSDPVKDTVVTETQSEMAAGTVLSKKNAIDGRDWTYWREKNSKKFNDPGLDPAYVFNDPDEDSKAKSGYQWMHDAVGTYKAWGVTKGAGVTVAVIDTGVYADHPDLKGKVTDAGTDPNFSGMVDTSGHGTHVAGIIAATAGNGIGGTGIAPEAKILAVPVFVASYYEAADLIKGIDYVTNGGNKRADVINMSLGGPVYNEAEQQAITAAYNAGITICVAMGNDHANCKKYPAAYDHLIAVAAVDESHQKSDFSTYGSWADVSAPGTAIFSTWNGSGEKTPNQKKDYYSSWNGTSMACPVVSGVCALYISAARAAGKNPTPDEVEKNLKKTTVKISSSYSIGTGMVNAPAMLLPLEDTSAPKIDVPSSLSVNSLISLGDNGAAGGTIGYIYTVNGKKPSASKGEVKEGFFVEAASISGNVTIPVLTLLDNGLMINETNTLKAVRITGLGTMTETAEQEITLNGDAATGLLITGTEYIGRGKSVTYKLNRKFKKNAVKWKLGEGAPAGVTISAKSGKVKVKKTSSGSFTVVAEIEGGKAEKKVNIIDPASAVRLKADKADDELNRPVNDKNGNLKSIRVFNVDLPRTAKIENTLTFTGNVEGRSERTSDVEYISSKPSVASIDKSGKLTAKKGGTTKITCRALDGSGKKAVVTVKVNVPVSRLDLFLGNGLQAVGFGRKVKVRAAVGSAYGKPSEKKIVWDKEPVKVVGYSKTGSKDITSEIKANGYIKTSGGNISASSKLKDFDQCVYYEVTVGAKAADGSGSAFQKTFKVIPSTTFMKPAEYKILRVPVGTVTDYGLFTGDLGWDYTMTTGGHVILPEVKSSNPAVVSAYVYKYSAAEGGGLLYTCILTCKKKGNASVTIKATDGSGKKSTVYFTVY